MAADRPTDKGESPRPRRATTTGSADSRRSARSSSSSTPGPRRRRPGAVLHRRRRARVKRHQVLLLSQVLGGPAEYESELGEAHRGLGITAPLRQGGRHLVASSPSSAPTTTLAAAGGGRGQARHRRARPSRCSDRRRRLRRAGAGRRQATRSRCSSTRRCSSTTPTPRMFPVSMATSATSWYALGQVISRVDDLDSVVPVLSSSARPPQFRPRPLPAVGPLLATLEHFSGAEWTDTSPDWHAYGIVADVMIAAAAVVAAPGGSSRHEVESVDVAVLGSSPPASPTRRPVGRHRKPMRPALATTRRHPARRRSLRPPVAAGRSARHRGTQGHAGAAAT